MQKPAPFFVEVGHLLVPPRKTEMEMIEERAYELWIARGRPEGSPEVDWCQAEEELAQPKAFTAGQT